MEIFSFFANELSKPAVATMTEGLPSYVLDGLFDSFGK